jgi:hypothetical protein
MHKKFHRVLLSLFFAEMGLFLIVFPWIQVWERNFFAHLSPTLTAVLSNYFFRGAISGLGIVNLWLSLTEILIIGKPISGIEK